MDKEYNNVEDLLTEGFWDSIINKAKQLGLAAGAAIGSENHRGRLDANVFATSLYDNYKRWQGQRNYPTSLQTIAMFLVQQIGLAPEYVEHLTNVRINSQPASGVGNQQNNQSQQGGNGNSGGYEDPLGHIQGGGEKNQATSGDGSEKPEEGTYHAEEGEFQPQSKALKDFMRYAVYGAFKRTIAARGFDPSAHGSKYSLDFDGSFIFSKEKGRDPTLADLIADSKNANDVQEVVDKLREGNYFGTWDDFKRMVPGGSKIDSGSMVEADLFRQALKQAELDYNLNFPKNLRRFVLAVPPVPPDRRAATNLEVADGNPSSRYASASESIDLGLDVLNEAGGISDSQLRKAFLTIAQRTLQDGQFRIAADNTLERLRGDNVGGAVYQGGNQGNNQGGNNQNSQPQNNGLTANDMLARAAKLGDKLGVRLDKFVLSEFKKKNGDAYREFMGWLKDEDPNNFDAGFLDHAKDTLSKYLDYGKLEDSFKRNGNPDIQSDETSDQSQDTQGQDAQGEQGGDGEQEADDGLKYYDIDRRKIAWDPKSDMLHIRNANAGGKAREKSYKRTETGWLTDSNLITRKEVTNQLDSWYDQVMKLSGGEAAKDDEPDTSDPNVIPSGATVVPPERDGQKFGKYTFDGKVWRNEHNTEVTQEKSIEFLNKLYREKHGGTQPEAPTDNQQDDQQQNGQDNQNQPEQKNQTDQTDQEPTIYHNGKAFAKKNGGGWYYVASDTKAPNGETQANLDKMYDEQQKQQGGNNADNSKQGQKPQNGAKVKVPQTGAVYTYDGQDWTNNDGPIAAPDDHKNNEDTQGYLTDLYNFEQGGGNAKDWNKPLTARLKYDHPDDVQGREDRKPKSLGSFTMPSGKVYNKWTTNKSGPFWADKDGKRPDEKTVHYLDREFEKQQAKNGNKQQPQQPAQTDGNKQQPQQPAQANGNKQQQGSNQGQQQNQQQSDERAVPMNATFRPSKKNNIVLQRKENGWVDKNGKLYDNPSQVDTFDRGWQIANQKRSA
jgi:hypothetical protein